jgi:hypothetical protein
MSRVPVVVGGDGGKGPQQHELLPLRKLWRNLESSPHPRYESWGPAMAVTDSALAHELRELITALDRRVPRVEQAGEAAIARDAAALRNKAIKRLAKLMEHAGSPDSPHS